MRNTERDIRRDVVRRLNRGRAEVLIDDESTNSLAASVEPDEQQLAATEWRQRLLPLVGRDTDLFLRIMMLGETQAEAGEALGLSHAAARKRHQRALQKTLQSFLMDEGSSGPLQIAALQTAAVLGQPGLLPAIRDLLRREALPEATGLAVIGALRVFADPADRPLLQSLAGTSTFLGTAAAASLRQWPPAP